jgi:hypothetical protein
MTDMMDRTLTRASLIRGGAAAGVGLAVGGLMGVSPSFASGATEGDVDILIAAEIAEALAVTTYSNIIDIAPFFQHLADDDQGYLRAARQEEMSHYLLEQGVTGQPSPFTRFYYPPRMFADAQTTLNVLVTLEDAFIAAYRAECLQDFNAGAFVEALGPTARGVALFCVEREPGACHRSLFAERLQTELGLQVRHLLPP